MVNLLLQAQELSHQSVQMRTLSKQGKKFQLLQLLVLEFIAYRSIWRYDAFMSPGLLTIIFG